MKLSILNLAEHQCFFGLGHYFLEDSLSPFKLRKLQSEETGKGGAKVRRGQSQSLTLAPGRAPIV